MPTTNTAARILRSLCQHVCGCYVSTKKNKTSDWNDLKLGTVVVLDSLSNSIDSGYKGSRVTGKGP